MGERRTHLIRWEVVTRSKQNGGLGLKNMQSMNKAFMAKLGWRVLDNKESLWGRVISSQYCKGAVEISRMVKKQSCSQAWEGITEVADLFKKGLRAKLYNGQSTLFWRDKWIGDNPGELFP